MWREYGSKGTGAALVFNTQKINYFPYSPLIIAKVAYKSRPEREAILRKELGNWANITLSLNLPPDRLHLAAYAAFGLAKFMALVTKHTGFDEEREWRVIYDAERDYFGYYKSCLGYFVGARGVEPKFKLSLGKVYTPEPPKTGQTLPVGQLTDMLEFILLGPSASSPLAKASFVRMLERNGKSAFGDKVLSSTIPLRPTI